MPHKEESILVKRFNRRDSGAFGEVYDMFYEPLMYYAAKVYTDTAIDAADVIHDVLLRLWQSPAGRSFADLAEIKAYLFVSIKNSRRTHSAHMKHIERYAETRLDEYEAFRNEVVEAEVFSFFHHAMGLIPEESARILELFLGGWRADEIAEKLGKNKQTIYNRKSEALAQLKSKLPKNLLSLLFILTV